MAACTLVVIVAFGSACANQTHQITPESFRSLQIDFEPTPTYVTKTTGRVLLLAKDFRNHLSILRNDHSTIKMDPGFSMTETALYIPGKKTDPLTNRLEIFKVPLDEISGYYLTQRDSNAGGTASTGVGIVVLGGLTIGVLMLAHIMGGIHD